MSKPPAHCNQTLLQVSDDRFKKPKNHSIDYAIQNNRNTANAHIGRSMEKSNKKRPI